MRVRIMLTVCHRSQGTFQREHRTAAYLEKPCIDTNSACRDWAAHGECKNNALFMIGTDGQPGACRESCDACPYPKSDSAAAALRAPKPVMSEAIMRTHGIADDR